MGKRVAEWIRSHPNTHLIMTTSRYGKRYFLVDDSTGEWYALAESDS